MVRVGVLDGLARTRPLPATAAVGLRREGVSLAKRDSGLVRVGLPLSPVPAGLVRRGVPIGLPLWTGPVEFPGTGSGPVAPAFLEGLGSRPGRRLFWW